MIRSLLDVLGQGFITPREHVNAIQDANHRPRADRSGPRACAQVSRLRAFVSRRWVHGMERPPRGSGREGSCSPLGGSVRWMRQRPSRLGRRTRCLNAWLSATHPYVGSWFCAWLGIGFALV